MCPKKEVRRISIDFAQFVKRAFVSHELHVASFSSLTQTRSNISNEHINESCPKSIVTHNTIVCSSRKASPLSDQTDHMQTYMKPTAKAMHGRYQLMLVRLQKLHKNNWGKLVL